MKLNALIPPIIFALLLAALTFLLVDRFIVGFSLPALGFLRERKESAYTVAEEVGDLYLLNTSEYRMKLIFPFDFVDRDVSWWSVKEMYERGFEADENQQELIHIYKACLDGGFDPSVDIYDFIVFTAVVKAGINISGTVFENPALYEPGSLDSYLKIDETGTGRNISVYVPEAEITDLYIDDRKPSSDNFPDAQMTPAQWRDLVEFLEPRIREKVISLGILEDAAENSRKLIETILRDSGFSDVAFTEREL